MTTHRYGDETAPYVLVQAVDAHSSDHMEEETAAIKGLTQKPFSLLAVEVDDWNHALSPWQAPAVFGNVGFDGAADDTLSFIQSVCNDAGKQYIIGGYSLSGLFALWSACRIKIFSAVAAASPSVWFPGFTQYIQQHGINCSAVYLSLGDREAKTRNAVMATVADRIIQCQKIWSAQNVLCTLEWNSGNHFRDTTLRTAKGFAWALEQLQNV